MNKPRNILLIGGTGNGKSTLANVLIGENEFEEGGGLTSTTKHTQSKEFTHRDIKYKVIDTVGLNDTSLSQKETLEKLVKTCEELRGGINQIFFVVKNKLTEVELENFNLLKEVLFGENVYQYTTVVRTDFKNFRKQEVCQAEMKSVKEDPKLDELVRICNAMVFVDNPPIESGYFSDEEEKQNAVRLNQKLRNKSREILLEHLGINCAVHELVNLSKLKEKVDSYLTKTQKLEKEIVELNKEKEELEKQLILDKEKKAKEIAELNKEKEELEKKLYHKLTRCIIN